MAAAATPITDYSNDRLRLAGAMTGLNTGRTGGNMSAASTGGNTASGNFDPWGASVNLANGGAAAANPFSSGTPTATSGSFPSTTGTTDAGNAGSSAGVNPWAVSDSGMRGTGTAGVSSLPGGGASTGGNMASGNFDPWAASRNLANGGAAAANPFSSGPATAPMGSFPSTGTTDAGNAGSSGGFDPWAASRAMAEQGGNGATGAGFSSSPMSGYGGDQTRGTSGAGMTGIDNPGAYTGAPVSGSSPSSGGAMNNLFDGSGTGSSANQPVNNMANPAGPPAGTATGAAGAPDVTGGSVPAPSGVGNSALPASTSQSGGNFDGTVGGVGGYMQPANPADMSAGADAAYKAASQFFDPDFARQRSTLENQLASQGFTRGSEAYNNALDDMQRQQNLARTNASLNAQGVGFNQSNQLIQNALAARAQDVAMRGQNRSVDAAGLSASATAGAAGLAANASNYRADLENEVALRGLGLSQNNQDFNQAMTLMGGARGGVNAPNFGPAAPLDVGSAYGIASGNQNAAANRDASNRNALYGLGATALGGLAGNYFGGY